MKVGGLWGLGSEGGEEGRDHEDRGKKIGGWTRGGEGRLGGIIISRDCSSLQIQAFHPRLWVWD